MKAQSIINLCKETNQNPVKVIFGGRENFKKLQQNHLQGKKREKLKQNWKEKRHFYTQEETKQNRET